MELQNNEIINMPDFRMQDNKKEHGNANMEIENISHSSDRNLYMLRAVKTTLITNSDIVNTMPQLTIAIDKFSEYLDKINKNPPETKDNLIKLALRISSALHELAIMAENIELLDQTNIKEALLREMSDLDLVKLIKEIYEVANMYQNSLVSFGIQEHQIVNLEYVMDDFCSSISLKGRAAGEEQQEDQNRIYDAAMEILNENIDIHIESIRTVYPRFYNEYQASRFLGSRKIETSESQSPVNWMF